MSKRILVIIRSAERERVAEALRAALGLGLRGDAVEVLCVPAAAPALESRDPDIERARLTLCALGHRVSVAPGPECAAHARAADAVEVWT